MRKFAIHCAAAATPRALPRMRFGKISPRSTHTIGPHEAPKEMTKTLAATRAIGPQAPGSETSPFDVGDGERERQRHGAERDEHADGAGEQDRAATEAVDQEDGDDGDGDVGDRGDDADEERVGLRESDGLPQRRRVVEDHVDADELLEDRQDDADPDDGLEAEAPCRAGSPSRPPCPRRSPSGCLRRRDRGRRLDEGGEDLAGLVGAALGEQVPR